MSEFQYVAFRAIDGPVSEKNLEYMRRQSTRAEVSPWSFDNEYHFGDFRGDAEEMLRRGYDLHLHYANFGIRKLMVRLPQGLPDPQAVKPYLDEESLHFSKDKKGPAGILTIEPCYEPDSLDELWSIDELIQRLVPLRAEIVAGDLRPFYLARLAIACDSNHNSEEEKDAPVPAGLDKLTASQRALAELYGIHKDLIAAAARNGPALTARGEASPRHAEWLQSQPEATKNDWLVRLLAEPHSTVRKEILAQFQKDNNMQAWPTKRLNRTIAELEAAAEGIGREAKRKAVDKTAKQRANKIAKMAADPAETIREAEKLVDQGGTKGYRQAAEVLADLREALAGSANADLAEEAARTLKKNNSTLNRLTSALRQHGFLAN